jgi:lipid-binding SYLF domain-containing protein
MRSIWAVPILFLGSVVASQAAVSTDAAKRLQAAGEVLTELHATPDNDIPQDLWTKADCVITIPGVKKAAFIVGGEYGKGVMSCREAGQWSAPVFMELGKGSWGFQAGAQEVDLVLLVMNRKGAEKLLANKVSLGADASVAAGPIGRTTSAATDAAMRAEILAWSRARGVFAGINLSGGVLKPDTDANTDAYGAVPAKNILFKGAATAPPEAASYMESLRTAPATASR